MKLTFMGRGAAFNVMEGNTNAYYIEDDKLLMVDCGETMFEKMRKNNILDGIKEVYVLVSHTHSDHCGSLGSFGLYCQFVLQSKLKIIVCHNEEYVNDLDTLMRIFGCTKKAYEFLYEEEIDGMFKGFDSVRYELTKHDYMLTCYSFVFETNEGAIFYSADTRVVDNMMHFIDTHEDIDCIYMEVTDLKNDNDIHLNLDQLLAVMTDEIKEKIYMMHLRNDVCKQKVLDAGFKIVEVL